MLILTRRVNERIRIGNDVTVTILSVNGQQVRIGIDCRKVLLSTAKRYTCALNGNRLKTTDLMAVDSIRFVPRIIRIGIQTCLVKSLTRPSMLGKRNYNFQKVAAELADYGFNCLRLSDDWHGADFIACHIDGNIFLKVQLKGRV